MADSRILLLGDERAVFRLHLLRVLLGAEIDRAQAVAPLPERGDLGLDLGGGRQGLGLGAEALEERVRRHVERLADARSGLGLRGPRRFLLRLGGGAGLAGLAGGALGGPLGLRRRLPGAVAVAQVRRGALGARAGVAERGAALLPRGLEAGGLVAGGGEFGLGPCVTVADVAEPAAGAVEAAAPGGELAVDGRRPRRARLRRPQDLVEGGALRHHRHPGGVDGHLDVRHLGAQRLRVLQLGQRALRFGAPLRGAAGLRLVAVDGLARGVAPALRPVPIRLGARAGAGEFPDLRLRVAPGGPGGGDLAVQFLETRPGQLEGGSQPPGAVLRLGHLARQSLEPVALLQAPRRLRRRVPGDAVEPVPAPEMAFGADEALAGPQRGLQRRAPLRRDHADPVETAGEEVRRLHMGGERLGTRRQGGRRLVSGQVGPAGAVVAHRRAEIVGHRRAERRLVAVGDAQNVHQAAPGRPVLRQELLERPVLGLKRRERALHLRPGRARRGLPGLGGGARFLGRRQPVLRRGGLVIGRVALRGDRCDPGGGLGQGRLGGVHGGARLGGGAVGAVLGGPAFRDLAFGRVVARDDPGHLLGHRRQRRLTGFEHPAGLLRLRLRRLADAALLRRRGGELLRLRIEPADTLAGIGVQRLLPLGIADELAEAAGQAVDPLAGLARPFVEARRLALELAHEGGGDRLLLPQRGQAGLGRLAAPGGLPRRAFGLGRRPAAVAGALQGRLQRLRRLAPAAIEQEPLGLAQTGAEFPVARRLPGLAGELGELLRQRLDGIVEAAEILLRRAKLQLGLVAALVEPRDPRRLLEDPAAVLRLGVDQLGDLALPHEGGGMRAGRGVGEEHLHVARADVAALRLVGRARVAGDAAHDLDRVVIVERRRCPAVGIVDMERDLGEVARRPGGGAGEDHVLHAAAAHGGGAALAHDPAQRLEKVRLAAAVGADHAGESVLDHQVGRVDEGLESVQPQPREMHASPVLTAVSLHDRGRRRVVNHLSPDRGGEGAFLHKISERRA